MMQQGMLDLGPVGRVGNLCAGRDLGAAAYDRAPAARATDPASSAAAEQRHTVSGQRGRNLTAALAGVRAHPGLTSRELAAQIGMDRHEAGRRLPELERLGLARKGDPRKCTLGHTMAVTWWAV